jgi:hypothetical protein
MDEVRTTADRMVADAKTASAGREDIYRRDAKYFKDTEDKVCNLAARSEPTHANSARIASLTKSIKTDNERLRTVTTDAEARVLRRGSANDALIASQCRNAESGTDVYFQCSAMVHARSWQEVVAQELTSLNTINDAAAGWTVGSLECLEAALTRRVEKEDLDLSESIYRAWTDYKNRRISSAQGLDNASLQFAQSK